jgi:hypothetical protein
MMLAQLVAMVNFDDKQETRLNGQTEWTGNGLND